MKISNKRDLGECLDLFAVVYLDDNLEQHRTHVGLVLEKLLGAGLYVKAEIKM